MDHIFSVSELNNLLKEILNNIGTFRVEGEVSEMRITPRQGVYITLSDSNSNISLSGYAPQIKGINQIEAGMKVQAQGYADLYTPTGRISISINEISPVGEGSLSKAYEKLKQYLKAKGYFDIDKKVSLPPYITKVALLTGTESAAFADFTKILKEHRSKIKVDFFPVIVQGINSIDSILENLEKAKLGDFDAIVLTRGGGSLEDLKSFNDEQLVKSVFNSPVPTIVGVGHESDESLVEFAADIRASTPSQCAYYLVNRNKEFIASLDEEINAIREVIVSQVQDLRYAISDYLFQFKQRIDSQFLNIKNEALNLERLLNSYDVTRVLKRGFSILELKGKVVKSIEEIKVNDKGVLNFYDGCADIAISNIKSTK